MSLPIFLIGARGCGKTTVGKTLAQTLGYHFSDTDHYLQRTTGKTVAEIVAEEGWEGFRQRETEALIAVTAPETIVATGGGMVLAEINRHFMQERGQVIWLQASAAVLAARLVNSPEASQRPTLTGRPVTEEIAEIIQERATLYQQTAHHIIDAAQAPEQAVMQILSALALARAS